MPHQTLSHTPPANEPTTQAEYAADPRHLPLGDLFRESVTLRLALERRGPGRVALIGRLVAVESALLTGGA